MGETPALPGAPAPDTSPTSWTVRIPEGVREVIGRRLSRLSEQCNQMLTVAAVLGRQFSLDQLAVLRSDGTREQLIELIDEAVAARLVEESPQAVGRYQFGHALIQETLAAELSLTRRVQVYAQVAVALERLYGLQAEQHAAELAHHFGQASLLLGMEKLAHYSRLAGERALAGYAYEEALAHFQRGLQATGAEADGLQAASLLWGLGRSQAALNEIPTAVNSMSRAFDLYLAGEDIGGAVAVAQYPWPPQPSPISGVTELIERALGLVSDGSLDAARMLVSYATALYFERGDYDAARRAFGRAERLARAHGGRSLELRVLAAASGTDFYHARFAEGAERGARALALAEREVDLLGIAAASWVTAGCLLNIGALDEAERCIIAGIEPAARVRDRAHIARVYVIAAWIAWLQGDLPAASERCRSGLAAVPEHLQLLPCLAIVEAGAGNFDLAGALVDRVLRAWSEGGATDLRLGLNGAQAGMFLAFVTRDGGRSAVYARVATQALSAADCPEMYRQIARLALGVDAVLRRDLASAREHYQHLRRSSTGAYLGLLSRDRVLGLLATALGDAREAAAHFEDALAFCRKGGYRSDHAWTCLDYAELLGGSRSSLSQTGPSLPIKGAMGGEGEARGAVAARAGETPALSDAQARATALLDEGLQIAQELGMRPLVDRILSLCARMDEDVRPA